MRADGRIDVMALLARPWDALRLICLARDYARALAALRGVGGLL
jgi:hypothetical protein